MENWPKWCSSHDVKEMYEVEFWLGSADLCRAGESTMEEAVVSYCRHLWDRSSGEKTERSFGRYCDWLVLVWSAKAVYQLSLWLVTMSPNFRLAVIFCVDEQVRSVACCEIPLTICHEQHTHSGSIKHTGNVRTLNRRDPKNATHARTRSYSCPIGRRILNSNTKKSTAPTVPPSVVWFELHRQLKRLHNLALTEDRATATTGGGATLRALPRMAVLPCPHLWIIWSQIVYLAFLKCYQCFLCAFASPLENAKKKKKKITPSSFPTQNSMSLWAIHSFGMTTNKIGPN